MLATDDNPRRARAARVVERPRARAARAQGPDGRAATSPGRAWYAQVRRGPTDPKTLHQRDARGAGRSSRTRRRSSRGRWPAGRADAGLCSPWQNDYRECSCYYWASARPDFVNVEPSPSTEPARRQLAPEGAHRRLRAGRLRGLAADPLRRPVPRVGALAAVPVGGGTTLGAHATPEGARRGPVRRASRSSPRAEARALHRGVARRASPQAHLVDDAARAAISSSPDGSRLFDADAAPVRGSSTAMRRDRRRGRGAARTRRAGRRAADRRRAAARRRPVHALSLAVAQKCNLGCTYCYAQQGEFGGAAEEHAARGGAAGRRPARRRRRAGRPAQPGVPRRRAAGEPGGAAGRHPPRGASARASRGVAITFSITTNGTLLTEADADFFEELRLRGHGQPRRRARGARRAAALQGRPGQLRPGDGATSSRCCRGSGACRCRRGSRSPRATWSCAATLDEFVAAGFHSVGFSPLLSSPSGRGRDADATTSRSCSGR